MALSNQNASLTTEFDRQLGNLISKGYPGFAGLTEAQFRGRLEPLARLLPVDDPSADRSTPFVLVVSGELVPASRAAELVERDGVSGFSVLEADDLARFEPIEQVELPTGDGYLMFGLDTGKATKNVTPNDALSTIDDEGRSPLTVEEGVALLTHFPDAVSKNNGFSLLGSRCGDKRVTAWWISGGRPKLGWCWAGNPHTWLGSASCERRIGC